MNPEMTDPIFASLTMSRIAFQETQLRRLNAIIFLRGY